MKSQLTLVLLVVGCGSDGGGGGGGSDECAPSPMSGAPTADEVRSAVTAYKAAHPGKDGDINAKTADQVAADSEAAHLLGICGADQRPVIPLLAWEYGGADHAWIAPEMSALVYCVYVPVATSTDHWAYDAGADHVTADVSILFPAENPCSAQTGANLVAACIGDPTNFEILVDIASYGDGGCAGLALSEASTELRLILPDGTKTHLWTD